jgi:phage-related protein
MKLTGIDGEIDAAEDFLVADGGVKAFDFQHSELLKHWSLVVSRWSLVVAISLMTIDQ